MLPRCIRAVFNRESVINSEGKTSEALCEALKTDRQTSVDTSSGLGGRQGEGHAHTALLFCEKIYFQIVDMRTEKE